MKSTLLLSACFGVLAVGATAVAAKAVVGRPAPAIATTDVAGKPMSLASYKGKYVVLEWTNPECPFVRKHYDGSGNMVATQKKVQGKDLVWITVQTSGDKAARSELAAWLKAQGASPASAIVDGDGSIGNAYAAQTTPHMYIIDPSGALRYAGAIDSKASSNPADIAGATNYVMQAMSELRAGKPVSKPATKSYGCTVKYPGTT